MEMLTASVGHDAKNQSTDVTLIQKLLNDNKITGEIRPLKIDGKIGPNTIRRIKVFQKRIIFMGVPDGRVDPNGKTFKRLSAIRASANTSRIYKLSSKATSLLKGIEKLATTPYDDQTALDITEWVKGATIGYGHLISKTEWPKYKNGISEAEAIELFQSDIGPFIKAVQSLVKTKIKQTEFDALVILIFNIGITAFKNSSALKLINNPSAKNTYKNLESAWKAWNKSNKKINKGLINRRNAEWNIFTKGIYQRW